MLGKITESIERSEPGHYTFIAIPDEETLG
jgi:hypothetical protein